MQTVRTWQLDPTQRSVESRDFEAGLRRKIVGQEEAVQAVVDLYQVFRAGLNSPGRPVGNLLFLGPTGAGKPENSRVSIHHDERRPHSDHHESRGSGEQRGICARSAGPVASCG